MKQALKGLFIIAFLTVAASCDTFFSTHVTVEFDYQKFNEERSLWNLLKSDNYQYNLEHISNGFLDPVNTLIIVENGEYKNQIPHYEYGYSWESHFYLTITGVYESIEREYKKYHNTTQSKMDTYLKKIEIKYDTENHIPTEIKRYYYVSSTSVDEASYAETKITEYKINN